MDATRLDGMRWISYAMEVADAFVIEWRAMMGSSGLCSGISCEIFCYCEILEGIAVGCEWKPSRAVSLANVDMSPFPWDRPGK